MYTIQVLYLLVAFFVVMYSTVLLLEYGYVSQIVQLRMYKVALPIVLAIRQSLI